jgi:hypothetical protein
MPDPVLAGGCQCGAVRYALHEQPANPHICHCRMCQKAFGSFFAPLMSVSVASFEVTRGELAIFMSSDIGERGFCRACGTPLTIHDIDDATICVSIGSLDEPERVEPAMQYGIEGRHSYFGKLAALPGDKTTENDAPEKAAAIHRTNHQHPDHDTPVWPPEGARHA